MSKLPLEALGKLVGAMEKQKKENPMGEHLTEDGDFKSDKYDWCPPGFVPLKTTDPMAQPVLELYARIRKTVDREFSDDLLVALEGDHYPKDLLTREVIQAVIDAAINAMHVQNQRLKELQGPKGRARVTCGTCGDLGVVVNENLTGNITCPDCNRKMVQEVHPS